MSKLQYNFIKLSVLAIVVTGCSSETVVDIGSYNSKEVISKSLTACHQKDFSEGKSQLERVMTTEKANPLYWNALGICYSLSNQFQKANYYYELGLEAITLYKGNDKKLAEAALLNNVGLMHLTYKRFNDAYQSFKKAEMLAPDLYSIQLNLSQLLLEFKYDDRALAILKRLESFRPGDIEVLYSLALIYSRKSDYEKALLSLSKINSDATDRPDISGLFAYNLLQTNQLPEAYAMIDKRKNIDNYDEFNKRNKILENEISAKLKEQSALKK